MLDLSYQLDAQGKNLLKNLVRFSVSGTVVRVSGRRGGHRYRSFYRTEKLPYPHTA